MRTGKGLAGRMGKTEMGSKHFLTETKWQPRFFSQTDSSVVVCDDF